jgi:HD superfamily phosphohydrolase YqeK
MILDEETIKLANTYGFDRHICKTTHDIYWECDEEDLLKFAQEIFQMGYNEGMYDMSY